MTRLTRAARTALAVATITLALLPSQAAAALLWTLTASPLTANTGVSTTFTLVGTNDDPLSEIGCIRVSVPAATIEGASIVSASNGRTWLATVTGNTVRVQSQDGGGRLAVLQSVTFKIQAEPLNPGAYTWNSNAYTRQDCAGTGSLLGVPPVIVVSGPAVTPTPTPTPTPNPTPPPTPKPTPSPTPLASLPVPSLPLPSLPLPTFPVTTPAPSSSPPGLASPSLPAASPSTRPSSAVAPAAGSGGSGSGNGSSGETAIVVRPGGVGVRTAPAGSEGLSIGGLGSLGGFQLWLVPGAVIAGPGLLAILWLAIQVLAGLAWLPAARRVRGREQHRRRRQTS